MKNKVLPFSILIIGLLIFVTANSFYTAKSKADSDSKQLRTLYLLRHAKSNHDNLNLQDFDRPLDSSGIKEANQMAAFMKSKNIVPDLIICSPSLRTKQTCEIICNVNGCAANTISWDSTIYACSTEELLQAIKRTEDKYKTVLFIGHNPSTTGVANALQKKQKIDEVKTCGLVCIEFPGKQSWAKIEKGKLAFYHKP
jgi:phosphohistidine phosphatase